MFNFFNKYDINSGINNFGRTKNALLIDVRTASEYKQGYIPKSINIELNKIGILPSLIDNKSTPLFVYCQSGGRSSAAAQALKNMGYINVTNVGGISGYTGQLERMV